MTDRRSPIDAYLRRLSMRLWVTAPLKRREILREVEDHLHAAASDLQGEGGDVFGSERRAVERFGRYPVGRSIAIAVAVGILALAAFAAWTAESPGPSQARVVRASISWAGEPTNSWLAVASVHPNQFQIPLRAVQAELPADENTLKSRPGPGYCGQKYQVVTLVWSDGTTQHYPLCIAPQSILRIRHTLVASYHRSAAAKRWRPVRLLVLRDRVQNAERIVTARTGRPTVEIILRPLPGFAGLTGYPGYPFHTLPRAHGRFSDPERRQTFDG